MSLPVHKHECWQEDSAGGLSDGRIYRSMESEETMPHGNRQNKKTLLILICSVLAPVLLPYLHLGVIYHLWDDMKRLPDRQECTCNCWDTVFKGPYESGVGRYKHVYFNVTSNTLKIWFVTVIAVITFYETVRRTLELTVAGRLRYSMACLLISIVYPHYYSWWSYFNYWNDDFYQQWNHQLIFSSTEILSTILVVHLMNRDAPVTPRKLITIIGIATFHILASGVDQFVLNVINQRGELHQVLRDLGFMIPDILHVLLPLYELRHYAMSRKLAIFKVVSAIQWSVFVALTFLALIMVEYA